MQYQIRINLFRQLQLVVHCTNSLLLKSTEIYQIQFGGGSVGRLQVKVLKSLTETRTLVVLGQAVLIHDPLRLAASGSLACVEHKRFLEPNAARVMATSYGSVCARGFPVARSGDTVGTGAVRVLLVSRAEEEPLPLALHESHRCMQFNFITHQIETNYKLKHYLILRPVQLQIHLTILELNMIDLHHLPGSSQGS